MARTSTAEFEIKPSVIAAGRPDVPYHLSDEEADEWRGIVGSMQPGFFARSHHPMLEQLCRHIVSARMIGAMMSQLRKQKKFESKQLTHLLSLQDRETKSIIYLMRSMRLTHQAVYRPDARKQISPTSAGEDTMVNPWEDDE